ncbi:MAG: type IX secretion system sortase PorU [Raineya sp.]
MLILSSSLQAQNSVLSSGSWYKIAVSQSGLYKITAQNLRNWGIDISQINPHHIAIYGNGGGMLPQANNDPRPTDLTENAIWVAGEEDNRFDNEDFIIFYAEGADKIKYNPINQRLEHEKNLYDDNNYYFLTIKNQAGLRVQNQASVPASLNISVFDEYLYHEKDLTNILSQQGRGGSGREWYGELFNGNSQVVLNYNVEGIAPNTNAIFTSSVLSQSFSNASFSININGQNIATQNLPPIVDATYSSKGSISVESFVLNTAQIPNLPEWKVTYSYQQQGSGTRGYLNYFSLQYKRNLRLYGNQTVFRSIESLSASSSNFVVSNVSADTKIWDISNPLQAKNQQFTFSNGQATFGANSSSLKEFIVWQGSDFPSPQFVGTIPNQNLRATPTPNLLIVAHPDFLPEAERLATFRRSNDGLLVQVANVSQIYNEFSSGRQDVSAIRDFVRYLYQKTPSTLRYVLLFGAASFDYKDRVSNNTNFVPIYESRESLHPIYSYSSDDYFGFLEDNEGQWQETFNNVPTFDHTLDVGVGRLPARTPQEAQQLVDKLIAYANHKENLGAWRKNVIFLADDGDANQHQTDADRLANKVEDNYPKYNVEKIYLDAFSQISSGGNERSPACKEAFSKSIDRGALIVNYTGHGGEIGWTQEEVFRKQDMKNWKNPNQLPLMVTATCEFGRYDDPSIVSGAEEAILMPNKGAIALVTTTRPVFSSTNFILNNVFYDYVFEPIAGQMPRLGDIIRLTKNASLSGSINRNFSLLGDPSMRLAYPQENIVITHISPTDTLRAMSKIRIEGEIQEINGGLINDFNGILEATIFDKLAIRSTLGTQNYAKMNFSVRDIRLFNGRASVKNGRFAFEFVVPRNINYTFGNGKISLYAADFNKKIDAGMGKNDVIVGGTTPNPISDNTPPRIKLFMNDTTFLSGGLVNQNPILLAHLFDENGINISSAGIGQDITAYLNDSINHVRILNNFYTADLDTYQSGKVIFPFQNLPNGKYTLTLKAWDTFNNSAEEKIDFVVASSAQLALRNVFNYPNPFSQKTTFSFEHNRFGEELVLELEIFNVQGEKMFAQTAILEQADALQRTFNLDLSLNGTKFADGVYIYRLSLRSPDGQKASTNSKLVILQRP